MEVRIHDRDGLYDTWSHVSCHQSLSSPPCGLMRNISYYDLRRKKGKNVYDFIKQKTVYIFKLCDYWHSPK